MTLVAENVGEIAKELTFLEDPHDTQKPIRKIPSVGELAGRIAASATTGQTLPTVVFWGPHPNSARDAPDRGDKRTIRMLAGLFDPLSATPSTRLTLILADVHGAFNGYRNDPYLNGIRREAEVLDADAVLLSDLYDRHGLPLDESGAPANFGDLPELTDEQYGRVAAASNRIAGRGGPREYVAMRLRELPLVRELLKPPESEFEGALLVIGNPDDGFFFDGQDIPAVYTRANIQSGKRFSNTAPWIPRTTSI